MYSILDNVGSLLEHTMHIKNFISQKNYLRPWGNLRALSQSPKVPHEALLHWIYLWVISKMHRKCGVLKIYS